MGELMAAWRLSLSQSPLLEKKEKQQHQGWPEGGINNSALLNSRLKWWSWQDSSWLELLHRQQWLLQGWTGEEEKEGKGEKRRDGPAESEARDDAEAENDDDEGEWWPILTKRKKKMKLKHWERGRKFAWNRGREDLKTKQKKWYHLTKKKY